MRQAVFVMVIVTAAFLGGAVVNGPGLRWVQARLLDYIGLRTAVRLPRSICRRPLPTPPNPIAGIFSGDRPAESQITPPGAESQPVKQRPPSSSAIGPGRSASSPPSFSAGPPPLPLPTAIPSQECLN